MQPLYIHPTLINNSSNFQTTNNIASTLTAPSPSQKIAKLMQRIVQIVLPIFTAVVGIFLYWSTPIIFAVGLLAGIVAHQHTDGAIQKIKDIWDTQTASFCLISCGVCFLSLPVTIGAGAFIYGAKLGSYLTQEAQKQKLLNEQMNQSTQSFTHADDKLETPPVDVNG